MSATKRKITQINLHKFIRPPFGRNGQSYNDMIEQTIKKEFAAQIAKEKARVIRNSNPKMIKVKNSNDHFNVLN